jgi:hypothetical protein
MKGVNWVSVTEQLAVILVEPPFPDFSLITKTPDTHLVHQVTVVTQFTQFTKLTRISQTAANPP